MGDISITNKHKYHIITTTMVYITMFVLQCFFYNYIITITMVYTSIQKEIFLYFNYNYGIYGGVRKNMGQPQIVQTCTSLVLKLIITQGSPMLRNPHMIFGCVLKMGYTSKIPISRGTNDYYPLNFGVRHFQTNQGFEVFQTHKKPCRHITTCTPHSSRNSSHNQIPLRFPSPSGRAVRQASLNQDSPQGCLATRIEVNAKSL